MPELPEVETVKLKIEPYIVGKTIESLDIFYPKFSHLSVLKGQTIHSLKRRGKYIIFILDDYYLISHLRMEGKYRVTDLSYKNDKHDLVFFNFKDFRLVYNDTRRFGVFLVFSIKDDIYNLPPLSNVGDEPFDISKDLFYKKISSSNDKIKSLLLDQSITSGLGNIYADEVLFDASINPKRPGKSLSKDETDRLLESSKKILSLAIENGGTTIKSFESFNNESGHFQISLKVHTKEGKRCPNCGNIILKDRIGGRSSYYCPTCQRIRDFKTYAITGTYSSGKSLVLSMITEKGYKPY